MQQKPTSSHPPAKQTPASIPNPLPTHTRPHKPSPVLGEGWVRVSLHTPMHRALLHAFLPRPPQTLSRLGRGLGEGIPLTLELEKNGAKNRVYIFKYLVVPESQNCVSFRPKPSRPTSVVFSSLLVLTAVKFYDEILLFAEKVEDVGAQWTLASEFQPHQPAIAKLRPKKSLCVR